MLGAVCVFVRQNGLISSRWVPAASSPALLSKATTVLYIRFHDQHHGTSDLQIHKNYLSLNRAAVTLRSLAESDFQVSTVIPQIQGQI